MAVVWGAAGTAASGTTSCTPAYPTGINALTSKLLCAVTGRSNTANTAFTMPAGWTKIGSTELEGGVGTWGVDTGTRRVTFFAKDETLGTETGTVTVSLAGTTANTMRATIFRVEVPSGYGIEYEGTTGADTTNGTAFSASGGAISLAPGDLLAVLVAQCIDTGTQSAQSITASGITFGTRTNRASTAVTNGNDHRHILDTVPVNSGSGSVAPTYAYTISAAGSGPVAFLRMREVAPPPAPTITTQPANTTVAEGATASFSVVADNATGYQWQVSGGAPARGVVIGYDRLQEGVNNITIPEGTLGVLVGIAWWDNSNNVNAMTPSSFVDGSWAANLAITNCVVGSPDNSGTARTHAKITATGAQTITIGVSGSGTLAEGATGWIVYLNSINPDDFVAERETSSPGLNVNPSTSLVTDVSNGLLVVIESNMGNSAVPSNVAGWTSLDTYQRNFGNMRLRTKNAASDPETVNGSGDANQYLALTAWSLKPAGGFSNVTDGTGGTTANYSRTAALADSGKQYRVVVTGPGGSVTSSPATLTVTPVGGPTGTLLKHWNGTSFVAKPLKRWNGTAWVPATLKRYNGSGFV